MANIDLETGESEEYGWLDGEEYTFPVLKDLIVRRGKEKERHERALLEIEERIREARATEQESFNLLLKGKGQDLKTSVVKALQILGWGKTVDVDEYWRKVIRDKEEDIWLIEAARPSGRSQHAKGASHNGPRQKQQQRSNGRRMRASSEV